MGRRWLAGALLLGLLLRLGFGFGYWVGKPLTLDEQEYLLLAHNLAAGRGFSYASPASGLVEGRHVGRAPLYPALLACLALAVPGSAMRGERLPTSTPPEVKAAQALVGCALIWLIARWAARAAGGGRRGEDAGIAAAFVAAVYPPLVCIASYVLSESVYAVLALAAAWAIDRGWQAGRLPHRQAGSLPHQEAGSLPHQDGGSRAVGAGWALAGGALAGFATLARPAALLFVALVAVWLVRRRHTRLAAAVAVGAILVVAPWTARNLAVHGRVVLVASEGGVTFWTGNNRLATGEGDLAANPAMKPAALAIEREHQGAGAEDLEGAFYRAALDDIRRDPVGWITLLARKAFFTVVPVGPSYTLHSWRYRAASIGPYLALLPLAAIGAWRLRAVRARATALWLLGASAILVCLVFFPQERFRIPVIDPVLIVCAAACAPAGAAAALGFAGRR